MDRTTKLIFAVTITAVCAMALSFAERYSSKAFAYSIQHNTEMGSDPYVVGFSTAGGYDEEQHIYRMWSDGTVELKWIRPSVATCKGPTWCISIPDWTPWIVVPDTAEGFACANDVDGNRMVNVEDLLAVIDGWGSAPSCADLPDIQCTLGQLQ